MATTQIDKNALLRHLETVVESLHHSDDRRPNVHVRARAAGLEALIENINEGIFDVKETE